MHPLCRGASLPSRRSTCTHRAQNERCTLACVPIQLGSTSRYGSAALASPQGTSLGTLVIGCTVLVASLGKLPEARSCLSALFSFGSMMRMVSAPTCGHFSVRRDCGHSKTSRGCHPLHYSVVAESGTHRGSRQDCHRETPSLYRFPPSSSIWNEHFCSSASSLFSS